MPIPKVKDFYTNETTKEGFIVTEVDTTKRTVEMVGFGHNEKMPKGSNRYDKNGNIPGYSHTVMGGKLPGRIEGKKKSRNKIRKNKRKTMRRNKFTKWF